MSGIEWLELYIPETKINQTDLAKHNDVDPDKYLIGLGQQEMAFCNDTEDNISMYLTVVERVLKRYPAEMFGFLGVGTESIVDGSKSIKSFLLDLFGESKPSYGLDTYHACYGGTASMLHALTWLDSQQWSADKPLALVVCGDIASFKHNHERCTGGAGAVAMVISREGRIIIDQAKIVHHMEHGWDFYKPLRHAEHPIVNGPLSIEYYLTGLEKTYTQLLRAETTSKDADYILMHTPYNKLVYKGFHKICILDGLNDELQIKALYEQKVVPSCKLSKVVGNIYTGSLYMCLVSLILNQQEELAGKSALLYSYGSGYMCTLLPVRFSEDITKAIDQSAIESMLNSRRISTIEEYHLALRQREFLYPQLNGRPVGHAPQNADVYILRDITNGIRTYQKNSKLQRSTDQQQRHLHKMQQRIETYNSQLPYTDYDWHQVTNRCCESIVGYAKVPIGLCGPAYIDSQEYMIPIATTEGALVASINRGAKLMRAAEVCEIIVENVGISRAPVLEFATLLQLQQFIAWSKDHLDHLVESMIIQTSNRLSLKSIELKPFGKRLYLRLSCETQDAMGMNMISRLTAAICNKLCSIFPELKVLSISSNYCTDKKNSALNWIAGRGRRCNLYCKIHRDKVADILHVDAEDLVKTHTAKNLIGSSMAGTIGGHNSHVANVVAGIYLATGQDIAQVITSAMSMIHYELAGDYLEVSLYMPSIECGTVGGGTHLETQQECLRLTGVDDAESLAKLIIYSACAGELSLLGALTNNEHMQAHDKLNKFKK